MIRPTFFHRFQFFFMLFSFCAASVFSFVLNNCYSKGSEYHLAETTISKNFNSQQLKLKTIILSSRKKQLSSDETNESIMSLMDLSSAHFTSQALHTFTQLGIADMIGDEIVSLEEICSFVGPRTNVDAMTRTLRLLVSANILEYVRSDNNLSDYFRLSNTGALLQTQVEGQPSMASGVRHWMEKPLWNAWLHLPEYIQGPQQQQNLQSNAKSERDMNPDPFERSNGQSSDYYYNAESHPDSLQHANDFVRFISDAEIESIVSCLDWSQYASKKILDVGGYNGKVLDKIALKYSHVDFNSMKSLDLPHVVQGIKEKPEHIELIGGNILNPSSVPYADVILMKHFLDRCMWNEVETIKILQTCHDKLPNNGQLILAEAVIPDFSQARELNRIEVALDALYMLVGRERQRTESEWKALASKSGFMIKEIIRTNSVSCSLIVLIKCHDNNNE